MEIESRRFVAVSPLSRLSPTLTKLNLDTIMCKAIRLRLPLFLLVSTLAAVAQFAHTNHKQIVDAAGKPLLTRATNLGNWLVPEGYMWLFEGGPQSADFEPSRATAT
jgi:hypothetical protein